MDSVAGAGKTSVRLFSFVALLVLASSCGSDNESTAGRFILTFRDRLEDPGSPLPGPLLRTILTVNAFDAETLKWVYPGGAGAASLPVAAESPSGFLVVISATSTDGILVFGGTGAAPRQVLHYARASNAWTLRRPMPEAKYDMTATLLNTGRVLLAGGGTEPGGLLGMSLASAVVYDPATDEYDEVGAMNQPRERHYSALLADGRVLLAGGSYSRNSFQYLTSAEIYDPSTRTFTLTGAMSGPRIQAAVTTLADGRVLFVGDGPPESSPAFGYAEIYDSSTGAFLPTAPTLQDRHRPVAVTMMDGRVLIAGGRSNTPGTSRTAEIYDPVADQFLPAADMTVGRWGAAAALLPDGRVLVIGGFTPDSTRSGCEIYAPDANSWTALADLADEDCSTKTTPVSLP